jgi:hypothetical protein
LSTAEEGGDGCQNEEENGGKQLLADLARRKLTIFAIGEERQGGATGRKRGGGNGGRQQRLRRSKFAGVEVIYVRIINSNQIIHSFEGFLGRSNCFARSSWPNGLTNPIPLCLYNWPICQSTKWWRRMPK